MERARKNIVFLDTHVVIWLYDNLKDKFSRKVIGLINSSEIYVSPLVSLEIEYLFEVRKLKERSTPILASLEQSLGLKVSENFLPKIIEVAITLNWTRDPFDRLLVAESYVNNAYFITKDKVIRKYYSLAVW